MSVAAIGNRCNGPQQFRLIFAARKISLGEKQEMTCPSLTTLISEYSAWAFDFPLIVDGTPGISGRRNRANFKIFTITGPLVIIVHGLEHK